MTRAAHALARLALGVLAVSTLSGLSEPPAHAQHRLRTHVPRPPTKVEVDEDDDGEIDPQPDWIFDIHPEYRFRLIGIRNLDVNGVGAEDVFFGEQRVRLDFSVGKPGIGAIHMQVDMLDGVLFGSNGEFGGTPGVQSGLGIATRHPNYSGWAIGQLDGGDPLSLEGYGLQLREVPLLDINFAYAEVMLPIGLLRVGRQPLSEGASVFANDGRSFRNRWGVSWFHTAVDRIAFGTKIDEAIKLAIDPDHTVDTSLDEGVVLGLAYDFLVMDQVQVFSDNLMQAGIQLMWRDKELRLTDDFAIEDFELMATFTHRWEERFNTEIYAVPVTASMRFGPVSLRAEYIGAFGTTREIAVGFAELTSQQVTDQAIAGHAARAIVDVEVPGKVTLTAEFGFSSGDDDPRSNNTFTQMAWPRDTNLGLLMFEHTLAYQSARSAAVGIENLQQLDAESFPISEVATEGRVQNVIALFPQVFWDPVDFIRVKAGALFAWSHQPITDPIQTSLNWDGESIDDDRVNYHGGRAASYWGTEFDLGVELYYKEFMQAVVEGAILLPGPGMEDANGDAVTSWMLEARFVFAL